MLGWGLKNIGGYDRVWGMKNRKKITRGFVDVSRLNASPEDHEYETAEYFAGLGLSVVFIEPSNVKGANSPDFIMGGKIWETKSPTSASKSSIEHNFKKAMHQSTNIIFDLRRLSELDERKYIQELRKRSKLSGIKTLVVITRAGEILTLRGVFDIM